jgi:Ni/Co efflux regulator RcnB
MRFSEHFNLPNHHQRHYEFVNIRVDSDNMFFIDPTRIEGENSQWAHDCADIIQDFFHTIFNLYNNGETERAREFFGSSGESNEIFLGYTKGFPRGLGNSEESLTKIFDYVHQEGLLNEQIVGRLEDFHIFVPDFGPDLLSDLVASLIKFKLVEFTQEQCELHGIPLTIPLRRPYWNMETHSWGTFEEMLPDISGNAIVLIPKEVVVGSYLYDASRYWVQVVSIWRQRKHQEENSTLHRTRPENKEFVSKKEIRRVEIKEQHLPEKEYLVNMTRQNRVMIEEFRNNIENTQRGTNSNKMDDDQLEDFIENSYDLADE